jgi:hypothetical protein
MDRLSPLPVELKSGIIRLLHARDRIHLRLISHDFNTLCLAEGLFEDEIFIVRPHVDDMERLRNVSQTRGMTMGIRHLKLFVGDVGSLSISYYAR